MISKRYLRTGLVFFVIGFTTFIFANEINKSPPVPETEFDIHVVMTALIQPNIFNITLIDGVYEFGQTPDCDFGQLIRGIEADPVNFNPACNDIDNAMYLNIINNSKSFGYYGYDDTDFGVGLNNIMLHLHPDRTEDEFIVLALTMIAVDADHGFIFPPELNPEGVLLDYQGQPVGDIFMPLGQAVTIYLNVPNTAGEYHFRCSYFCHAGHFGQIGRIIVT